MSVNFKTVSSKQKPIGVVTEANAMLRVMLSSNDELTLFCAEWLHGVAHRVQKEPRCSSPTAAETGCFDERNDGGKPAASYVTVAAAISCTFTGKQRWVWARAKRPGGLHKGPSRVTFY